MGKNAKTNGHLPVSGPTPKLIHSKYHQRDYKRRAGMLRAHGKLALITQTQSATEQFNAIVQRVTRDLGGVDQISEIEKHLITSFVGAAILQGHQLNLILTGQPIDIHEYASVTTAMIRTTMRLGTKRRQKELNPLDEYLYARSKPGRRRARSRIHYIDAEMTADG